MNRGCKFFNQLFQVLTPVSLLLPIADLPVQAQSITPAIDGTGTVVTPNGDQFTITGGLSSQDGGNLFHSFEQFGLNQNQIATFLSNPNIHNILGRVVGGSPSVINGLIQVAGGSSNLFLVNPAGIVFGANASLSVPASFTATTASHIGFNNEWLNSIGSNDYANLIGAPNSFAFAMAEPGSIVNAGSLAVPTGQNLALLGGTLVNTGSLSAPGGHITVTAVPGEKLVRLSQSGSLLSLEFHPINHSSLPTSQSPLSIPSLPQLLTGGDLSNATGLRVNESGQVELTRSSIQINSGDVVAREITAQTATLSATNNLVLVESQLKTTGDLNLLAKDTVLIRDSIENSFAAHTGGNLSIQGNQNIDILALNHLQSETPFQSSGRLSLVSDGNVSGDAHFASDKGFSILTLSGQPGSFVSLYDPIISAAGDVQFGDYTGASLKVEATGSIIGGNIIITQPDAAIPNTDPDFAVLSGGRSLILRAGVTLPNPGTIPQLNIGGTDFVAGGSVLSPGSIQVGKINIRPVAGVDVPGSVVGDTGSVILFATGNLTADSINLASQVGAPGGGPILIDVVGNLQVGDLNGDQFNGLSSPIALRAGGDITTGTIRSISVVDPVTSGNSGGGAISLNAGGAITVTGNMASWGTFTSADINLIANKDITVNCTDSSFCIQTFSGGTPGFPAPGNSGNVKIESTSGKIVFDGLEPFSFVINSGSGTTGDAGDVQIIANKNIEISGTILSGSNSTLIFKSETGDVNVNGLASRSGNQKNAGSISVQSASQINIDQIDTYSNFTLGGGVTLTAPNIKVNQLIRTGSPNGGDPLVIDGSDSVFFTSEIITNGADVAISSIGDLDISNILNSSSAANKGGNVTLTSTSGRITTTEINSSGVTGAGNIVISSQTETIAGPLTSKASLGNGSNITLTSSGNITTTGALESGAINGNGGNIRLTSGGIINTTAGDIDSSVDNAVDNVSAGSITLNAVGNITTGDLFADVIGAAGSQSNGGIITLTSSTGSIDTSAGDIFSFSNTQGNGGNIDFTANGTLTTGQVSSASNGGNGGAINFIASDIFTTDQISSVSTNGAGGGITLTSNSLNLNGSLILGSQSGQGSGALTFNTSNALRLPAQINTNGADIVSTVPLSSLAGSPTGTSIATGGGNLTLPFAGEGTLANNIAIATDGGDITITSPQTLTILAPLSSASATLAGGNITLISDTGAVRAGDLTATGVSGGTVTVQATTEIRAGRINTSATQENGGNVFLDPDGNVEVAWINAQGGPNGQGGTVDITTRQFFLATDTFTALNNFLASISTVGGLGGGNITIRHDGGARFTPFNVTNLINNGTAGVLTSGNETIEFGRFPGPYTQGNIRLITSPQPTPLPRENPPEPIGLGIPRTDFPLEEIYTREFERFDDRLGETRILSLEEMQETLQQVEDNTGIKPALIYVSFAIAPGSIPTDGCKPGTTIPDPDNPGKTRPCQCPSVKLPDDPNGWANVLKNDKPSDCDRLALTLVTSSGKPVYIPLSTVTYYQVITLADQFRTTIENRESSEEVYRKFGNSLYKWLVEPLRLALRDRQISNLSFILPPKLRLLPFAAFTDDQKRFLIETYSTGLMPSLSLVDTRKVEIENTQILAMGTSEFRLELGQRPLPHAEAEIKAITPDIWPGKRFLNEEFTLNNLVSYRAGIIHLATHGEFSPTFSKGLIYLRDRTLSPDDLRALGWRNPPIEMFVLSACQTAQGDENAELGFAGATFRLGVKSVLGSLWYVEDESTSELMQEFYQQLKKSPTKSDALARAQQVILRSPFAHPYYWSPFTLVGNPW